MTASCYQVSKHVSRTVTGCCACNWRPLLLSNTSGVCCLSCCLLAGCICRCEAGTTEPGCRELSHTCRCCCCCCCCCCCKTGSMGQCPALHVCATSIACFDNEFGAFVASSPAAAVCSADVAGLAIATAAFVTGRTVFDLCGGNAVAASSCTSAYNQSMQTMC